MKYFAIASILALSALTASPQRNYNPESALIPLPAQVSMDGSTGADLTGGYTTIAGAGVDAAVISALDSIMTSRLSAKPADGAATTVTLGIDSSLGNEAYRLSVADGRLTATGGDNAGLYYAMMTLDQILLGDTPSTAAGKIAAVEIDDRPRFGRRALMLDPARHFLPVEDVKSYIDRMSRYKFNTLQLHLTDDEGWRMEILSHPELTATGAFRKPGGSPDGPDNGFYTQSQLRDIIDYAAKRYVEIIPEFDIPGHTAAILAAHPEMGCLTAGGDSVKIGETHNLMLCASEESVYSIYDDILREVAEVFPARQIHLGGDESVIDRNWGTCPRDSALMLQLGYTAPAQLMNRFFGRILDSVRRNGKEAILWCELDNIYPPANEYLFDYPADVTLVTWRYGLTPKCIELTRRHGNRLIMAPGEYAYLDYPQMRGDLPEFNNWGMPVTTLRKVYEFDPGYGLPAAEQAHIDGVMATLWGEAINDIHRASYMTYPRALAIAEAAWTPMERRSWHGFRERMWPNLTDMMRSGTSVRAPFEAASAE